VFAKLRERLVAGEGRRKRGMADIHHREI